ncbi:Nucleotide-binding universal stress protein, UspA family [Halobiforma haloterrestris]|uniref:Nucleotide-binding universal stress protein, UspA family n=1 Tax=Natronobacterium haloterrestre TaxID=148448 RepID=A0A1I1GHJ8_NATHA|nr:universal stress protein [Halobiforma haloterrestris]SFC08650.1 Nucleotide-binding universal stress protein, UspA family [Halobiforma haloterrestris]
MTFVVPFDGSELAEAALVRAVEYARALDQEITTVTVVPERKRYAREKGWIDADEPYDVEATIDRLRDRVHSLAPDATFEYERIREFPPEDRIADHVERLAREHDPSVVFLGSDNVGRVVTPLTSVGVHVAAEQDYDVFIVRHAKPPKLDVLEPHEEFYDEESD